MSSQDETKESPAFVSSSLEPTSGPRRNVHYEFGAGTHVGLKRANNEDHFAVVRRTRHRTILLTNVDTAGLTLPDDDAYVLIVADGIGGCGFGELASELILRIGWELASSLPAWVMKYRDDQLAVFRERIAAFGRQMQAELQEIARADPQLEGMGTTWTCVYAMELHAIVAQVGDSRAYLYRSGKLCQLTRDHTYGQQLLDSGVPLERALPYKNTLLNAFGAHDDGVEIDVDHVSLQHGDRLLVCSDGLSDMASDDRIAQILADVSAPQAASDALIRLALDGGGKDNVTVIVADLSVESPSDCENLPPPTGLDTETLEAD